MDKNKLKIKVNYEGFKLDVVSDKPNQTLQELIKLIKSKKELIDSLGQTNLYDLAEVIDEDDFNFDYHMRMLTKELKNDKDNIEKIRNLSLKHGDFIHRKERLDIKCEVDLENKSSKMIIEKSDVKKLIQKLMFEVNPKKVKHIFLHIIGEKLNQNQKHQILDEIKKNTSFVDTSFLFTKMKIHGTIVSGALFFGDFNNTEEH